LEKEFCVFAKVIRIATCFMELLEMLSTKNSTAMDQEGEVGHQRLVRGVNWAPDSEDEADDSSTSEVRSGDTEVPDSEEEVYDADQIEGSNALECMSSTDVSKVLYDKELVKVLCLVLVISDNA
jgi:hypothetical protein